MRLTIDRTKWDRGNTSGVFFNPRTNASCFVGHLLLALGAQHEDLVDDHGRPYGAVSQLPVELRDNLPAWLFRAPDPTHLFVGHLMSDEVRRMVKFNDSKRHSLLERESYLAREAGQFGIDVEFVGDPAKIPDRARLEDMCDHVPAVYDNPRPKE